MNWTTEIAITELSNIGTCVERAAIENKCKRLLSFVVDNKNFTSTSD